MFLSGLSKAYGRWWNSVKLLMPLLGPTSGSHHTSFEQISSSVYPYPLLIQSLLTMMQLAFCADIALQGSDSFVYHVSVRSRLLVLLRWTFVGSFAKRELD